MALRATGGVLLVISFILFTYNMLATAIRQDQEVVPEIPVTTKPRAARAQPAAAVR